MKLLDVLFESRVIKKDLNLDKVRDIISQYKFYYDFSVSPGFKTYKNFIKDTYGDNWETEWKNLTSNLIRNPKSHERYSEYTPEYIEGVRQQYIGKPVKDFVNNEYKLYRYLYNVKGPEFYQNFRRDMVDTSKKVDDETLRKIASEYDGRPLIDFIKEKKTTYNLIRARGKDFLNDVTKNMVRNEKQSWINKEDEIRAEALKYDTLVDFYNNSRNAFNAAKRLGPFKDGKNTMGFYYDITKHLKREGNRQQRLVYVHEFRTQTGEKMAAYVGITYKPEQRYKQHMTGLYDDEKEIKTSPVTKFLKDNPTLVHDYKQLTDFMDEQEALIEERKWEETYLEDGWLMLNIRKGGSSLGGGFRLKTEDLFKFVDWFYEQGFPFSDLRKNYPNISSMIYKRQLNKPENGNIFSKFNYSKPSTEDERFNEAMKYSSVSELRNKNQKLYWRINQKPELLNKVRDAYKNK